MRLRETDCQLAFQRTKPNWIRHLKANLLSVHLLPFLNAKTIWIDNRGKGAVLNIIKFSKAASLFSWR